MGPENPQVRSSPARMAPHRRYFPIPASRPVFEPREAEPENSRRNLRKFLAIYAHLGILMLVFQQYRLEGRGFQLIAQTVFFGLPVHYLLPYRLKKPFFLGLSILGMGLVYGAVASAWILAGCLICATTCLLPVAWPIRAGLVAAEAVAVLAARASDRFEFLPETVVPVLGSMLMFRSLLLLYELKHAKKPEKAIDVLGYYCLLPNFCFLHFPVIDYRGLSRSYFARDIHIVQQNGLRMIFRGVVHLLLYRLVYHELLIAPSEVQGIGSLLSYLSCNYLLYLHVSGQFHLACGMLHLFGYALPETHHRYLLATSFTDYWRRINIYWKDFMVRLVFNPIAFRMKRRPQWQMLATATCAVFLTTWILHAYQSYWLRGTWGFSAPDALFWGILGVLVLINVQWEARSRPKRPAGAKPGVRDHVVRGLKVGATLACISVLWSLWSSPSLGDWIAMFRRGLTL